MIKPLKPYQKVIAYSSLMMVLLCTLIGLYAIWLYLMAR